METFKCSIYQYKNIGLTVENLSVNDCQTFEKTQADLEEAGWTQAEPQPYISPLIHGYVMNRSSTNNNSITCAIIDYTGNMDRIASNPANTYHTKYALISVNVQGMSDVVIPSRDDDVDFTLQDLTSKFTLIVYSTNGFRVVNKASNTTVMQGGNITGEEDFSIPLNCCILHIIRSTTYSTGVMLPTNHFMLYPWGSISTDATSSNFGPLIELETPTYRQLVPYLNVSSYYRSYLFSVTNFEVGNYYYRSSSSYYPICKTTDSGFSSIPAVSFSLYGGLFHQYSDDYCTLDVQLVSDMIEDAVSGIALPDDYVTR